MLFEDYSVIIPSGKFPNMWNFKYCLNSNYFIQQTFIEYLLCTGLSLGTRDSKVSEMKEVIALPEFPS